MSRVHRFPSGKPGVQDPMHWADKGACKSLGPAAFFPFPGRGGLAKAAAAKALCASCEVQTDCLAYALRTDQPDGIWGGMTADERQALPRPPVPLPISHGTPGGYKTHRRRGEEACAQCQAANTRYYATWREEHL